MFAQVEFNTFRQDPGFMQDASEDTLTSRTHAERLTKPIVVRRSWTTLVLAIISVAIYYALSAWVIAHVSGSESVVLPLVPLITAVILIRPVFLRFDSYLEIAPHHVRFVSGTFSLRRKRVEFPYEDILGVEVEQHLFDRLLNVGTISLGTAMRSKPEIVMTHIHDPHHYAQLLTGLIDRVRMTQGVPPRRFGG